MLIWLALVVTTYAFSLAEWTAKHGLTYHPEKLRWEKAWVIFIFCEFLNYFETKLSTLGKGSSCMHERRRTFGHN